MITQADRRAMTRVVITTGLSTDDSHGRPLAGRLWRLMTLKRPARRPASAAPAPGRGKNTRQVRASILRLPVVFEENVGQAPEGVRWVVTKPSGVVWFLDDHVVFHFPVPDVVNRGGRVARSPDGDELSQWWKSGRRWRSGAIRMRLQARRRPKAAARLEAHGQRATKDGAVRFRLASSIMYESLAPGVDLRFYDDGGRLRYDIILAPEADVTAVGLRFDGAVVQTDPDGNLAVLTADGGLWQSAPRCVTQRRGRRVEIAGGFVRKSDGEAGFRVLRRPRGSAVTIDPELIFGSYLGATDESLSARMNASGVYCDIVYGTSWFSAPEVPSFPHTLRRYDCTNPEAPQLVYTTVVRARIIWDLASAGPRLFLAGLDLQDVAIPSDALDAAEPPISLRNFILRIEADGMPSRATFYRFPLRAIAVDPVDPDGGIYVSGDYTGGYVDGSPYGPALRRPREYDTIVAKFDADLRNVVYFTSLGSTAAGASLTSLDRISVANGAVFIVGRTNVSDFATPGAFSAGDPPFPAISGSYRLFVTKLNPLGTVAFSALVGDGDTSAGAHGIAALSDGTCIFSGYTGVAVLGGTPTGDGRRVLCRVAADGGAPLYVRDVGHELGSVAAQQTGAAWLGGLTQLYGLATPDAAQQQNAGHDDGFLCRINPEGTEEDYYTYIGGSGQDAVWFIAYTGNALYALGPTSSAYMPTAGEVFQSTYGGQWDLFLAILAERPVSVTVTKSCVPSGTLVVNQSFVYTIAITNAGTGLLSDLVLDDVISGDGGIELFPAAPWQDQNGRLFVEGIGLAPGETREFTLDGIALEEGCSANEAVVSLGGVRIAAATFESCVIDPVGATPDLQLSVSDDSAAFASDMASRPVTIIAAIRNLSTTHAVRNVALTHRSQSNGLRFARFRPSGLTISNTAPAASWDSVTGDVTPPVRTYDTQFDVIDPGETVRVFATSVPLKNDAYASEAQLTVDGYEGYLLTTSLPFTMGPVADVRLALAVLHVPAVPGTDLQRFEISVARTDADTGQNAPALGLHAEIRVPHGTPVPHTEGAYSQWLTLWTGGNGTGLRVIDENASEDTWLASFVVTEIPEVASIHLRAGLVVSSVGARIEGPLRNPPAEAIWP